MTYLAVHNWHKYQHYRDRRPVWVKYHVDQLHSRKLAELPILARFLWTQFLLLAAEWDNAVPNDPELVAKLTGICGNRSRSAREQRNEYNVEDVREAIDLLVKGRWLRVKQTRRSASKPASKPASDSAPTDRDRDRDRDRERERSSLTRESLRDLHLSFGETTDEFRARQLAVIAERDAAVAERRAKEGAA